MARTVHMNGDRVINGSFGECYIDGEFVSEAKEIKATIRIDREEVRRSSTRNTAYKAKGVMGEGTLVLHKVTSKFLKMLADFMANPRSKVPTITRLVVQLDDPESLGVERVALKNVKFWELEFGWTLDSLLEESIPFTFEDIEMEKAISGDPTR